MLPGDRLICAFVEPQELGSQFSDWLLHVTIVPWFRTEMMTSELAESLESRLKKLAGFTVMVAGEDRFGPEANKLVNLIELPSPFEDVHRITQEFLRSKDAWLVEDSTKYSFDYRPHVTAQGSRRLNEGDSFECNELSIIEQKGGYKEIVAEVRLGAL